MCESHRPDLYRGFLQAEGSGRVRDHYKLLAGSLLDGGCDGLILDTMNCWSEAQHALDGVAAMSGTGVPVIVSLEV